jgi:CHAT domain-containing protein/tetratricopeptide (TPR) repeat protein
MGARTGTPVVAAILLTGAQAVAASPSLEACDAAVRAKPGELTPYQCYGTLAVQHGLWDEAVARLESHLERDPENTYALGVLAYVEHSREQPRAEGLLRRILELQAGRDDVPMREQLWARTELVRFLADRGRLDDADDVLREAMAIAERIGSGSWIAEVGVAQAWQAWRRAEYGRAELLLRGLEDDVFPEGHPYHRSSWLSAMGAVLWAEGRYEAALDMYRRQVELLRSIDDRYLEAAVLQNIALLTREAAEKKPVYRPLIRKRLEEALASAEATGNLKTVTDALLELATLPQSPEERRRRLRRGLRVAAEIDSPLRELECLRLLAASLLTEHPREEDEGRRLLVRAERIPGGHALPLQRAHTARVRAYIDSMAQGNERAVESGLHYLEAIESIRESQPEDLSRARTFARWSGAYEALASRMLLPAGRKPTRDELELGYRVLERRRARLLLDEMDAARVTSSLVPANDPRVASRARVLASIAGVQRRLLHPSVPPAERGLLLDDLERLEVEEAALRAEILRTDRRLSALRAVDTPSLDTIQTTLRPDEALLVFQLATPGGAFASTAGESLLLAITRDGVDVHRLPGPERLGPAVELFSGMLHNRDGSERNGAARLYRDLLADALAGLPPTVRHLTLAPDGALHRVPWAALRRTPLAEPLAATFRITLTPSATAWLRWRTAPGPSRPFPVLALADPRETDRLPPGSGGTFRAFQPWLPRDPLPRARAEARAVVRHLGSGSRLLEGRRASEAALKRLDLADYGMLHFATHALLDEGQPERSALLLVPGDESEDGLVQVREITGLAFDGSVVVLSACHSATGSELAGEGVLSLARAFLVSGSRAVVGSLWPLRDDEAARLFDRFYRRIAAGDSLADALATAQAGLAASGEPAAAWSGVVVVGDGAIVPVTPRPPAPAGRTVLVLVAVAVASFALAGLLISRRRGQTTL